MNAARRPKSTPAAESPPLEAVPGPVARQRIEPRWLGVPARFFLLCLGFAALGAAIGLFATGSWAWGVVALLVAGIVLGALGEAVRQNGAIWGERSARAAGARRAQAGTFAEVCRARLEASLSRWRTHSRLDQLELEEKAMQQALGEATWRGDDDAAQEARRRLEQLEEEKRAALEELDARLAGAEERIRLARLPVQETLMVTPEGPNAPYPPPDEGNPPEPARVPEPYPPPDEGTPPTPAPDPGRTGDE